MTDINSSWNDSPSRKVIFNPLVSDSVGNIKKTYAEVETVLASWAGYPSVLEFVGACTIPAGGAYRADGVGWETDETTPATVTIADGASFDSVPAHIGSKVTVVNNATSAPCTVASGTLSTVLGMGSNISCGGAAAAFVAVSSGAVWAPVMASNAILGDGTNDVVSGVSGSTVYVFPSGTSAEIKANCFSGPAGFSVVAVVQASAIVSETHGSLTDAITINTGGGAAAFLGLDTSGTTLSSATELQTGFDDVATVVEANQTHAGGDGSDHADVATNTAALAKILKGRYTSTAAVNNDVTLTGVTSGDAIVAQINVVGSTPRTILSAEYESADTVRVTFSGDPSTDHVFSLIAYVI
jgi:hypothetical protein